MSNDSYLKHYGVMGMKWGVRRSEENIALKSTRKNPARSLSNDDLRQAISRMQLEKQYKDLNPKGLSKANKIALSVLAIGSTVNAAIAFSNSATANSIKKGLKIAFDRTK